MHIHNHLVFHNNDTYNGNVIMDCGIDYNQYRDQDLHLLEHHTCSMYEIMIL